jgi:hypothetical protein
MMSVAFSATHRRISVIAGIPRLADCYFPLSTNDFGSQIDVDTIAVRASIMAGGGCPLPYGNE